MKLTALKAMERDLKVILDDTLSGPETSKALASAWRGAHEDVLRDAQGRSGTVPAFDVAVDQKRGKPVETAEKIIVSVYDYRREIVDFIVEALIKASPKKTGAYINAHTVFVNGEPVGQKCPALKESDTVFVANPLPYARRIEIGRTRAGRTFTIVVPNRIYERVAKSTVKPLYRSIAEVSFRYVDLSGSYVTKGKLGPTYMVEGQHLGVGPGKGITRKRRQKAGTPVSFPAIFVEAI